MQHSPGAGNSFGGVAQAYGESVPMLVLPTGSSHARWEATASVSPCPAKSFRPFAEASNRLRKEFRRCLNSLPPRRQLYRIDILDDARPSHVDRKFGSNSVDAAFLEGFLTLTD
jgi:hypothetical protein